MGKRTLETKIGAHHYRLTKLGAETADEILVKLGLALGGVALGMATGRAGSAPFGVQDIMFARDAFREKTELGFVDEFVKPDGERVGTGKVTFQPLAPHYEEIDDYGERMEWLLAAWEHTFGPISAVRDRIAGFRTALLRSISPATPDGNSTVSSSPSG